jgi:hypothetical protein
MLLIGPPLSACNKRSEIRKNISKYFEGERVFLFSSTSRSSFFYALKMSKNQKLLLKYFN